jgi:hypothetical protein
MHHINENLVLDSSVIVGTVIMSKINLSWQLTKYLLFTYMKYGKYKNKRDEMKFIYHQLALISYILIPKLELFTP